ncbi:MAG TPA: hypothetical protein VK638_09245 [Edaphobacter sp.]|jgi:hypothetical protein|nr:hypothetical protein [Edaphobacter sp.]
MMFPLDGELAAVLLDWQQEQNRSQGLVFPSPLTGGCYHANMIQKLHLKRLENASESRVSVGMLSGTVTEVCWTRQERTQGCKRD